MEQKQCKYDIAANWEKAKNFIPKENEIIYYSDINNFKVGDGKTKVNDLEFFIAVYAGEGSIE